MSRKRKRRRDQHQTSTHTPPKKPAHSGEDAATGEPTADNAAELVDRRGFLKKTLGGLAAASLITKLIVGGAATLVTVGSLAGLKLYFDSQDPSKLYGPLRIGATQQIIPKRYPEHQAAALGLSDQERNQTLPFIAALANGNAELTELFFQSSRNPLNRLAERDRTVTPERQAAFMRQFPDGFTMSDSYKRGVLAVLAYFKEQLHLSGRQYQEVAEVLVRHGADPYILLRDPDISLEQFQRIIDLMPRGDDPAHVSLLQALIRGAGVHGEDGWRKITYAVNHGIDVNRIPIAPIINIGTALHIMIANENFEDALRLVEIVGARFNPGIKDVEDKTALIIAAKAMGASEKGEELVLKLLQQYTPEQLQINAQDDQGRTALHYAAAYGSRTVVEALKAKGADMDIRDRRQQSPRDYGTAINNEHLQARISGMLREIEISSERDEGAIWNAIVTSDFGPFATADGKAILANRKNMDDFYRGMVAAIEARANELRDSDLRRADTAMLNDQRDRMAGRSVMDAIMAKRREREFTELFANARQP